MRVPRSEWCSLTGRGFLLLSCLSYMLRKNAQKSYTVCNRVISYLLCIQIDCDLIFDKVKCLLKIWSCILDEQEFLHFLCH